MVQTRRIVIGEDDDAEGYAHEIALEVSERGEVLLQASGANICKLFESLNIAKSMLEANGVKIEVMFKRLGVARRFEDKTVQVVVHVKAVEGGRGSGEA